MSSNRRRAAAILAAVAAIAAGGSARSATAAPVSAGPQALTTALVQALPAPYSQWNVTIDPSDEGPGTYTVAYDSPALKHRSSNTVYLPASYAPEGSPFPVLYFLHGTVLPFLDIKLLDPLTCRESFLCMVSGGGGKKQSELEDFPSQRHNAKFLVVAPDTDPDKSWCETCWWIDGRTDLVPNLPPLTARTVPAETVLNKEVLPLVEHLYNVRRDRGGRGVIGFSMGGAAATLQAFRHPDLYVYMGSITGIYDIVGDTPVRNALDAAGYFRDQGYPSSITAKIWWENFDPHYIAANVIGSGMKLMFSAGDLCLPPRDAEGQDDCRKYPPVTNPLAAVVERILANNIIRGARQLPADGLEADQVRFSGVHGANNHRVYAEVIVPQANAVFAAAPQVSDTFSYRSVDSRFSIWGYDVDVTRLSPQFFDIENARHDARAFTLNGSGNVAVHTPPVFTPGSRYHVTLFSSSGQLVTQRNLDADADGRLSLLVNLADVGYRKPAMGPLGSSSGGLARITISTLL